MTEQYLSQPDGEQSDDGKKPFYKSPLKLLAALWVGKKLIGGTVGAAREHRETTAVKELRAAQKERKRQERAAEARAAQRQDAREQRRKQREQAREQREKQRDKLAKELAKERKKRKKRRKG